MVSVRAMELLASLLLLSEALTHSADLTACPVQHIRRFGNVACCSRCPPGTLMKNECTATSRQTCQSCPEGLYLNAWNNRYQCLRCDECGREGMRYKRNCTVTSNAECDCIEGYACKDNRCRTCIRKGSGSESKTYSPGSSSVTGIEPPRPQTNNTTSGDKGATPTDRTIDGMDISVKSNSKGVEAVTITVALISLLLLCLLLGIQLTSWRRNRRKSNKLLPAEMRPWYLKVQTDDTHSTHFPEQECGGLPHQERKNIEKPTPP
ncbi:tumor necrosis factor receptor superfamily member 9-like isoform X2 [Scyliorhinus canicula]|uniref:tumor necrosis factor receptor superfamily member 9-like isoform X2 n=1 Tax=Scyliorhinus canicula TaxID=7830 RepID=UPI0018F2939B|nr:tumor necrosis factor receptor superfamily member 9-like isoform X2 [Scyliorhinus canicula]